MLDRIGFNRAFLRNPVTWIALAILVFAGTSAVRADRHYDLTCALAAPIHAGPVNNDEYFVQPTDTIAYNACKGRVPARWKNLWPLADCSPGGRPRYSDGSTAMLTQKCQKGRSNNSFVL
jgi:hypothetical protein